MLTPSDIENKKFSKKFNGYNVNEVDDFLDEIVVEFKRLCDENENLKHEIKKYKNDEEFSNRKKLLDDM